MEGNFTSRRGPEQIGGSMKVKCRVCDNEKDGFCKVKKIGVKVNKSRTCEAYIYNESKVKAKQELKTTKISYADRERAKAMRKEELKKLRALLKEGQRQGTAKDLGLIEKEESRIIKPGDPRFVMPNSDPKHPLTGDLSRFTTTVSEKE